MGHLLSAGIKMQGGAPATATLQINNYDGVTVNWYKNGVNQGSVSGTLNTTLNNGDTFYLSASNILGVSVYYFVNGSFTDSYFDTIVVTSTYTAIGGNSYQLDVYLGA